MVSPDSAPVDPFNTQVANPYDVQHQAAYQPPPFQSRGTSMLAIISLAGSVLGIGLLGIVAGFVALSRIKRTGDRGRKLAIAGVVIGLLEGLAALLVVAFLAAGYGLSNGSIRIPEAQIPAPPHSVAQSKVNPKFCADLATIGAETSSTNASSLRDFTLLAGDGESNAPAYAKMAEIYRHLSTTTKSESKAAEKNWDKALGIDLASCQDAGTPGTK